jgi:hypothetical protein
VVKFKDQYVALKEGGVVDVSFLFQCFRDEKSQYVSIRASRSKFILGFMLKDCKKDERGKSEAKMSRVIKIWDPH